MRVGQLYEKLSSVSIEESLESHPFRQTDKIVEHRISDDVVSQLKTHISKITAGKQEFMDCVVTLTLQRVSSQRLCYRIDSELYAVYNNPESREAIRTLRTEVQTWIREIQKRMLALDSYLTQEVPAVARYGMKSAYETVRKQYAQELQGLISEFIAILEQQKRDLKELCNEYCNFVSEQYYASKLWSHYR